jgi:hypothetical protein
VSQRRLGGRGEADDEAVVAAPDCVGADTLERESLRAQPLQQPGFVVDVRADAKVPSLVSFGAASAGNVYAVSMLGTIYELSP